MKAVLLWKMGKLFDKKRERDLIALIESASPKLKDKA